MAPTGGVGVAIAVRESRRARRLILQVLPPRTIEVIVPRGVGPGAVESFIREHRGWIRRAGRELLRTFPEPDPRPSTVELKAVGETVAVTYLHGAETASYRRTHGSLQIACATTGFRDAPLMLRRWLIHEGANTLKPWLTREAERTGLKPRGVQVRLQKTRWGSCSAKGNISLNAALLLVPPALVRYLFIHELCHLRHLSHSKRYWNDVARHERDFRSLDRRLAESWRDMPSWLQPGG